MRIGQEAFTPNPPLNPLTRVLEDFPQIKEGAGGDKQDGEDGRGGDSGRKEERGWRESRRRGRLAAAAAVSLTASRQHIHQAPTMLRERNHNLQ